jgi:hypothetical protein
MFTRFATANNHAAHVSQPGIGAGDRPFRSHCAGPASGDVNQPVIRNQPVISSEDEEEPAGLERPDPVVVPPGGHGDGQAHYGPADVVDGRPAAAAGS